MFAESVSYPAALLAGVLSFFSPCILPLIPGYFTFITGYSLEELTGARRSGLRRKVILSTSAFVLGFTFVFILLGASASLLGNLAYAYKDWIRVVGGVIIILLGLHLTGLIRFRGLDLERRLHLEKRPLHFLGTFFIGMAFAAGWSPCIGPLLGSILIIAGSRETVWQGMGLLAVYSAGLGLWFVGISVFINFILVFLQKAKTVLRYVNVVAGSVLILIGLSLVTDRLMF
jgi:cytochrome c-type biogenesis protein